MRSHKVIYYQHEDIDGLEILNCQDSYFSFPLHLHVDYCIWLNTTCGENIIHKGVSRHLHPGYFGVIYPGEAHSNAPCGQESRNLKTFYLSPKKIKRIFLDNFNVKEHIVEFKTNFYKSREMIRLILELETSLLNSCSSIERQTAFLAMVLQLGGICGVVPLCSNRHLAEDRRLKMVIELFNDRMEENLSLDEVASYVSCTPYYLIRFFKKATGLTPHAYLIQLRLERAKNLLSTGNDVADTAIQTGFNDQSHLYKYFEGRYGLTPRIYQNQVYAKKSTFRYR